MSNVRLKVNDSSEPTKWCLNPHWLKKELRMIIRHWPTLTVSMFARPRSRCRHRSCSALRRVSRQVHPVAPPWIKPATYSTGHAGQRNSEFFTLTYFLSMFLSHMMKYWFFCFRQLLPDCPKSFFSSSSCTIHNCTIAVCVRKPIVCRVIKSSPGIYSHVDIWCYLLLMRFHILLNICSRFVQTCLLYSLMNKCLII